MATIVPQRSAKRQRLANTAAQKDAQALADQGRLGPAAQSVVVQFQSAEDGSPLGPAISLPASTGQKELEMIVNHLRSQSETDPEDPMPFAFHVALPATDSTNEPQRLSITKNLTDDVLNAPASRKLGLSTEDTLTIVFEPQAVFRVRAVNRCSSTMSGHSSPILCSTFSPTGLLLATGAGDQTCRLWDLDSETPLHTLVGHSGWVLCAEWEGRERKLATGGMEGDVWVWDAMDPTKTGRRGWGARSSAALEAAASATGSEVGAENGAADSSRDAAAVLSSETPKKMTVAEKRAARHAAPSGHSLKGHTKWVTSLSWEPIHSNARAPRLASSSKDGTVRVWNVTRRMCEFTLGGHTASVNAVRWGGEGALYTASSDRTVKVWSADGGKLIRTLSEHAHWVNTMALSTDFVLRTGPFDFKIDVQDGDDAARDAALARYKAATASSPEMCITGSDDHTLFLWAPQVGGTRDGPAATPKKPIARLTGHQKTVNHVAFSPDGRWIASAGFDNAVKLWEGRTGKFVASLRGHVAPVYRVAWSSDSRMLVSASKDSTIKLWDLKTFKIKVDLPGHTDEVYCVDFVADKVASGGRDRTVKIWRH